MSNIGIIMRADQNAETLGYDWKPVPLGEKVGP
jgi:hypothetical protein